MPVRTVPTTRRPCAECERAEAREGSDVCATCWEIAAESHASALADMRMRLAELRARERYYREAMRRTEAGR